MKAEDKITQLRLVSNTYKSENMSGVMRDTVSVEENELIRRSPQIDGIFIDKNEVSQITRKLDVKKVMSQDEVDGSMQNVFRPSGRTAP